MTHAHLRRAVLAALTVAFCTAPAATADDPRENDRGGARVAPARTVAGATGGELLGAAWAGIFTTHIGDQPSPCPALGPKGKVLVLWPSGETVTCTIKPGTPAFIIGWSTACSNVEPPPFFGADEAAQRECAVTHDHQFVEAISATVDDQETVDIHTRRFEVISPQVTVQLPPDNILGVPPQEATFVAHAWTALVRALRPGRHTITIEFVTTEFAATSTYILDVLPRGPSNPESDNN